MKIRNFLPLCLLSLTLAPKLWGADVGFAFIPSPEIRHDMHVQGVASPLNQGDSGVAFTGKVGVNLASPFYDPNPNFEFHFDAFFGAIASDTDTQFGPGHLEFGFKWRLLKDDTQEFAFGFDLLYALAQSEAFADQQLGLSTPYFIRYFEDIYAFNPKVSYLRRLGHWSVTAYGGIDAAWLTDQPTPYDDFEFWLESGGGVALALTRNLRLSGEAAVLVPLTEDVHDPELWVGPGVVWDQSAYSLRGFWLMPTVGQAQDALSSNIGIEAAFKF